MAVSRFASWMKEHQIWGVVVGVILTAVAAVAHHFWTRESTRVSVLIAEGSLLNDEMAKRVGKQIDVRVEGTSLKDPRTATVWLTNTGTTSITQPEFCMLKKGGQFVTWSIAEGTRVLRDGAKGDVEGDLLRLQLPFLNPGERTAIQVLTQGTHEAGISVESATAGLVLEGSGGQPNWNSTIAGIIVGIFFIGGWMASSITREAKEAIKQIRQAKEKSLSLYMQLEDSQTRPK